MKKEIRASAGISYDKCRHGFFAKKNRCHAELVEAWWADLSARSFDKLSMTGPFLKRNDIFIHLSLYQKTNLNI
jgi:hypothetical protein